MAIKGIRNTSRPEARKIVEKYLENKGYSKSTEHYLFEFNLLLKNLEYANNALKMIDYYRKLDVNDKKVLDAGCGGGGISIQLSKLGAKVTGVDLDVGKLELAKQLSKDEMVNPIFKKIDLIKPFFEDNSFDTIYCINALEHVDPKILVKRLYSCLKSEGTLVLKTPNRLFPFETHIKKFFLHYLPISVVDFYLRHRYKSFFFDYKSFSEIKLLSLRSLKSVLKSLPGSASYSIKPVFWPYFPNVIKSKPEFGFLKPLSFLKKSKLLNKLFTSPKMNLFAQSWIIFVKKK